MAVEATMKLSIQLYSLRDAAKEDLRGVIEKVARMGYEGVELAGLHGHAPVEVRKWLDDLGIVASSAHCGVYNADKRAEVEDEAIALGHRHLVGGFGRDSFASEASIRELSDRVSSAAAHFVPRGFSVGLHNHWWEFDAPNKGDLLLELCPAVHPQLDVYWVQVGGADPVQYLRKYAGRAQLVHLKDGPLDKSLPMTAVGKGKVDIAGVVRAAREIGVQWGIVEIDRCDGDMVTAVRESHDYLRGLLG
jgi:sugar phosphate isomerase/epimerase